MTPVAPATSTLTRFTRFQREPSGQPLLASVTSLPNRDSVRRTGFPGSAVLANALVGRRGTRSVCAFGRVISQGDGSLAGSCGDVTIFEKIRLPVEAAGFESATP